MIILVESSCFLSYVNYYSQKKNSFESKMKILRFDDNQPIHVTKTHTHSYFPWAALISPAIPSNSSKSAVSTSDPPAAVKIAINVSTNGYQSLPVEE